MLRRADVFWGQLKALISAMRSTDFFLNCRFRFSHYIFFSLSRGIYILFSSKSRAMMTNDGRPASFSRTFVLIRKITVRPCAMISGDYVRLRLRPWRSEFLANLKQRWREKREVIIINHSRELWYEFTKIKEKIPARGRFALIRHCEVCLYFRLI